MPMPALQREQDLEYVGFEGEERSTCFELTGMASSCFVYRRFVNTVGSEPSGARHTVGGRRAIPTAKFEA